MNSHVIRSIVWIGLLCISTWANAQQDLSPKIYHLRNGTQREWSHFPEVADAAKVELRFSSKANDEEWALRFMQEDVRETWKVRLNGRELGQLIADEKPLVHYLAVPPDMVLEGENTLVIEQVGQKTDDIKVGLITLLQQPRQKVLSECTVEIDVTDVTKSFKDRVPVPCRLTILNVSGHYASVGASSNDELAVRPGVIYTATGKAKFGLPFGKYKVIAGRGFEYSIHEREMSLSQDFDVPLESQPVHRESLQIYRDVPTPGYVSCDTHIHTLTHSGHGDATDAERVITLAGEGIELPIVTEHNRQVDYQAAAVKHGVRQYFTPVIGNEVTTPVGHFNVFPLSTTERPPEFNVRDWKSLFQQFDPQDNRVVILNHARDIHSGFRPFGPDHHLSLTGENLDGWELGANAMEVINSGAQQTDMLQLVRDWFGMLNRGHRLTPVGSSDSHDVSRYIVGQGRTYIRCRDDQPGDIPVAEAIESFRQGRVMVGCGLLAEILVNGKYGPGDLAPPADKLQAQVTILGPSWLRGGRMTLYANGELIQELDTVPNYGRGAKGRITWDLPRFKQDVYLVAVVSGPGDFGYYERYWPIAQPYQPTSPRVRKEIMGISGAVWVDADGDGQLTSAAGYARRLWAEAKSDTPKFIASLSNYDEAIALQAASLLKHEKAKLDDPTIREAAKQAGKHVERGFTRFADAWRDSEIARSQRPMR